MKRLAFKMYLKEGQKEEYRKRHNEGSQSLGNKEIIRKWWDYMADIMEVNPDNSPLTAELEEVFYLK